MNRLKTYVILGMVAMMTSCVNKNIESDNDYFATDSILPGDKSVYGLTCDGCTDSVFVLLPLDFSDPITFNIIDAIRQRRVFGHTKIGDMVAVVPNEEDSTVADMIINLEELKGTWCYKVTPRLKGHGNMADGEESGILSQMPDSIKAKIFAPREYGFSLRQHWQAKSVGYVRRADPTADESPVEYPQLSYFTEWHMWNGKLIITSGEPRMNAETNKPEIINEKNDTCDILYLREDSLVLGSEGATRGYYRQKIEQEESKTQEKASQSQQQSN